MPSPDPTYVCPHRPHRRPSQRLQNGAIAIVAVALTWGGCAGSPSVSDDYYPDEHTRQSVDAPPPERAPSYDSYAEPTVSAPVALEATDLSDSSGPSPMSESWDDDYGDESYYAPADSEEIASLDAPWDGDRDGAPLLTPEIKEPDEVATRTEQYAPQYRLLTASLVDDTSRFGEYLQFVGRWAFEHAQYRLDLTQRMRFQVVDDDGIPVNGAMIELPDHNSQTRAIVGHTHADGVWDFFPGLAQGSADSPSRAVVSFNGARTEVQIDPAALLSNDVVRVVLDTRATAPRILDLAFVIDVTGSMGDELDYVTNEVVDIINRIEAAVPNVDVRVSGTFYRDQGDTDRLQHIPFWDDAQQFANTMAYVYAGGGGDYPEDMNLGLQAAMTQLDWTDENAVHVMVLIADAPPQSYGGYDYLDAMHDANANGIRLLPVAASGADRDVESLFRAMGVATSTPYVWLTDDSGIGGSHLEADTPQSSVEYFADMLTRLIVSDLRGLGMHETQQAPVAAQETTPDLPIQVLNPEEHGSAVRL